MRWIGLIAMVLAAAAPAAGQDVTPTPESKIAPWLEARLRAAGEDSFLVLFDAPEDLARARAAAPRGVADALRGRARARQTGARRWLEARGVEVRPLWIVGALQVRGDLSLALALAARHEVVRIVGDPQVQGLEQIEAVTDAAGTDGIEYGIAAIRADQVWVQDGARGEGIVVASADTGVEWTHPAIRSAYRGWNGEAATHDFHWYDAIENQPAPLDDNDHGTHTVGTMVGDDGAGNQIGVAPAARWIGCRNMDHGVGRPSTYLDCMQYFLAPWPHGGDPEIDGDPAMAPHVVNNSWGCPPSEGCDADTLRAGVAAVVDAGILFVAAAGNSGPYCSSVSDPPAIYEESLVAGATDSANALAFFSSKGPVTVDGSNRLRPDLAAPGVSVRSSVRGGGYAWFSGTSMASPHTAGAAALLWSAKPQVSGLVRISRCLVTRAANPAVGWGYPQSCGGTNKTVRPNNLFGWGLVDVAAAVHLGPDGDADGIADPCDCAPAAAGAYDPPGEVRGLSWLDGTTLVWTSLAREAGTGTVYDVLRGDLADLRTQASIEGATCLLTGGAGSDAADPELPPVEAAFYYLVQARNACGTGGYGADSAGTPRTHAPCP